MKKLLIIISLALSGCVVAPVGGQVSVRPVPEVNIIYTWDSFYNRYYYIDRGNRRYMPPRWHDHDHPHGGPPGHRKKH